ncbi:ABC transporter permease [Trueperella sp. LYQ143]|uniref:ABC transporter permease n=1 Tax=Trueperella sp. LYQ143 TaxID=3391059 RepID=UPI0039831854
MTVTTKSPTPPRRKTRANRAGATSRGTKAGWNVLSLALLAFFVTFVVFPLILVLYRAVVDPETGSFSTAYFAKFMAKEYYWGSLVNSFKVTIVATLIATVIGLPMAYVLRSVRIRGSKWINILIVISYLSPPFIGAYAWVQLLGRNGYITRAIHTLTGIELPGIYGFPGIVLVFCLQSFPLIYMYISGALKNLDSSLIEAAQSLGCNAVGRVLKVVLPLVVPTLLASMLLVFMRVFSDFGTPMLIGEGYQTFPVLIYNEFMGEVSTDDHFAAALCVVVVLIALVLFFAQRYISKRLTYSMTALKPMQAEPAKGLRGIFAYVFVYGVLALAILPQVTVIATSFMGTSGGVVLDGTLTLDHYRHTLFDSTNSSAIWNTYLFGLAAIILVVVIGMLVSYLSVRKPNAITGSLDVLSMFPYIIPGSVLAISFLYGFNSPPIFLSGTAYIIIVALAVRRMPYTIRSSSAILGQISPSLEEAAISLGASEFKSLWRVTIPMMLPGVFAGAIMSWITVISELSSSIILYTAGTKTLTVAIYTEVIRSNFGAAAAYSTILTLTSIISLLLFFKLTGKNDVSV